MSDREKLIELLESTESAIYWKSDDKGFVEKIADHLISSGVTFATDKNVGDKWIPVSERLPEDDSHVLVARKNGDVDTDMHIYTWWKVGPVGRNITHWMPLPEPPKECE